MDTQIWKSGKAAAVAAALALGLALPAAAVAGDPAAGGAGESRLSAAEVKQQVEAKGYTGVHDIEYDDGQWELDAIAPDGTPVDLTIDPATGAIVREDRS